VQQKSLSITYVAEKMDKKMATQYVSHTKLPLMLRRSVVVFIEVYDFLSVDFQVLCDRFLAQFRHFERLD